MDERLITIVKDRASVELALTRLTLLHPPFPVSVGSSDWGIVVHVEVFERDTGKPISIDHFFALPLDDPMYEGSETAFLEWVIEKLRYVFLHELAECLQIDGRRAHDVHEHGAVLSKTPTFSRDW